MPTIQVEDSRKRGRSTHVEPENVELHPKGETHDFVPGEDDDQGRVTCQTCGQLWEDKAHDHDQQKSTGRLSEEQRWVTEVRAEIDDYMVMLKKLRSLPPDEVFMQLSGITARLAEIRLTCVRSESRRLVALRTREIDPILEEVDRQFRFHSRILSVRQQELELSGKTT